MEPTIHWPNIPPLSPKTGFNSHQCLDHVHPTFSQSEDTGVDFNAILFAGLIQKQFQGYEGPSPSNTSADE